MTKSSEIDSRTLQSTPESGGRAGYNGSKRKKKLDRSTSTDAIESKSAGTKTVSQGADQRKT